MAKIKDWTKRTSARRTKGTECVLSSYGMSFNNPGGIPQSAEVMFATDEYKLTIELSAEELRKIRDLAIDYHERGGL